jgi:hypothetical protein
MSSASSAAPVSAIPGRFAAISATILSSAAAPSRK